MWASEAPSSSISKENQKKSFKSGHFYAKILIFRTHHLWNSTTELIRQSWYVDLNCILPGGEQFLSSELSPQSLSPLHIQEDLIHFLLSQVNSVEEHWTEKKEESFQGKLLILSTPLLINVGTWGVAAPIGPFTIYWKYIILTLNLLQLWTWGLGGLIDQKHEKILTWTVLGVASSCHCTWARTTTSISFFSCFRTRSRLDSSATGFGTWGVAAPIGPFTIYWKYIILILNLLQLCNSFLFTCTLHTICSDAGTAVHWSGGVQNSIETLFCAGNQGNH